MNETSNSKLTPYAKRLRKEMTKEEKMLWYGFLKELPVTVKRQKVMGQYIVDFYCASARIVIELDGSQHCEQENKKNDMKRDSYMRSLGVRVLRYSNLDVLQNFEGVCQDILSYINKPSP